MKRRLLSLAPGILLGSCTILFLGVDRCGDGVFSNSSEACDDGNVASGDGCSADCSLIEAGFQCPDPGQDCILEAICGDTIVNGDEECDDGNQNNTDDCLDTCVIASCGDGFIQSEVEACDPPNVGNCNANCQATCTSTADCVESPDNLCTENEDCDLVQGVCVSNLVNTNDTNDCTTDSCDPASGAIHDPEVDGALCDVNPNAREICLSAVCVDSKCGDGFVDVGGGEACDDGNNDNTDSCPDGISGSCQNAVCGDGFIASATEQCDDGNTTAGDGCDAACQAEADITADCAVDPNSFEDAINNAISGDFISVVNGDLCQFLDQTNIFNKNLTIIATGQPAKINDRIIFEGTSRVILTNINFENETGGIFITIKNEAQVGIINSSIENSEPGSLSRAIRCDSNLAKFVIDRSTVKNNESDAAIEIRNGCQGILANSLLIDSPFLGANLILLEDGFLNIVHSTFANNIGANQGIIQLKSASANLRIDNSVGDNNGPDFVKKSAGAAIVETASSFFENEVEFGITNADPALDGSFHITNAAIKGQGNPSPGTGVVALFFDPATIAPGLNVLNHDFNNNPRPLNQPDPGAFEEP